MGIVLPFPRAMWHIDVACILFVDVDVVVSVIVNELASYACIHSSALEIVGIGYSNCRNCVLVAGRLWSTKGDVMCLQSHFILVMSHEQLVPVQHVPPTSVCLVFK